MLLLNGPFNNLNLIDAREADRLYRNPVGQRLRVAAASALGRNGVELGAMASPPTITTGTSTALDASLTRAFRVGLANGDNGAKYRITGGTKQLGLGAYPAFALAPVLTMPGGSGGNLPGDATRQQLSWSVEFLTDAPDVMPRFLGSSLTYMVEVDDQPVSATGLAYAGTSGTVFTKLAFGSSKTRKIRIEMQKGSGFDGVYVAPAYNVWLPRNENEVRVAVVGDSTGEGTGATLAAGAWPKALGKLLGWTDTRQLCFGGTGFDNPGSYTTFGSPQRIADVVATNPDLIVIAASQNDDSRPGLQASALATMQAYRAALPNVPIVVMGVDPASSGPSATRLANEATVKAAFDAWGDRNSWWIPVAAAVDGPWQFGTATSVAGANGTGNRDRYAFDAAHTLDLGQINYALRANAAFRALVLPNL